jgi:RNA polymerase primary sigma factor
MAVAATKNKRAGSAVVEEWGSPEETTTAAPEPRSDDLQSYINRLTRCNLLTPDEEVRLARRIATGDGQAKERLVESNMRLVVSIAKAYRSSGIPFEDLIQEGAIGLMTAAERFDPQRGYRFSTYATQWIRQAIGRAVDNKAKSIRLPAHVSESLRKIDKARAEMRRELGEDPTRNSCRCAPGSRRARCRTCSTRRRSRSRSTCRSATRRTRAWARSCTTRRRPTRRRN